MQRALIDSDTGEILSELHRGDRIVRAASIEFYKEMQARKRHGRPFSKVDLSEGVLLLTELDANERSLLFILQYFVSYDSCLIQYRNGFDITFSDIVELSGWSKATASATINKLVEKNIVFKGRNGRNVQYYMNPWVISRGPESNRTLKEMFKNYRIRSKGNITWEELEKGQWDDGRLSGEAEGDIRSGTTGA